MSDSSYSHHKIGKAFYKRASKWVCMKRNPNLKQEAVIQTREFILAHPLPIYLPPF